MTGLVRKRDSFGMLSYFTIVGKSEMDCHRQVSELNHYGDLCEIRARFFLVATQQNGVWYDIEGKVLSNEYIRTYLEN